jgi:DNA-directed RNA polymerase subunit RPC12/RpoP
VPPKRTSGRGGVAIPMAGPGVAFKHGARLVLSRGWHLYAGQERTLPMSLYPCSSCSQRVPGKLAQIYWAWMLADESRVAYRQRLCMQCMMQNAWTPIIEAQANVVACPACHAGTVDDMDPVYATVFIPGQPRIDAEMALCAPCAVEVRNRALVGSEKLPDRQGALGGSSPPPVTATDAWAALGLRPNGRGPG